MRDVTDLISVNLIFIVLVIWFSALAAPFVIFHIVNQWLSFPT